MSYEGKNRSKSLLLSLGLRPCSLMRMLSHESELPCPTIPIRLVCPQADRKATKQNSCPWQYKMSLRRRLRTITLACNNGYIFITPLGYICQTSVDLFFSSSLSNPDRWNSPPGKGYCCGSRGAFFYCQRQLFCFLGA